MTWRELKVFIQHLPPGSATSRAMYGTAATWTPDTYLLADLWDLYVAAHTDKHRTPKTYPRPSVPT